MSYERSYNLFISHAWKYCDDYNRLVNLIDSDIFFKWKNYSVTIDDPCEGGNKIKLQAEIDRQLRLSSVVLIISGMYVSYREWIQFEIDLADKYEKPIIAIRPFGSIYVPSAVNREDIEQVGWRTTSIIDAIMRNAKD